LNENLLSGSSAGNPAFKTKAQKTNNLLLSLESEQKLNRACVELRFNGSLKM